MRTSKQIRASIKTIVTAAGKLQTKIHELALECLEHAQEHGDSTLIDKLVKELPTSQRVKALVLWVETFSPVRWSTKDNTVGLTQKDKPNYVAFDLESAAKTPYYELSNEKEPTKLTLEQLKNIVANLTKRIDNAEKKGTIAEGEDVTAMREFAKEAAKLAA